MTDKGIELLKAFEGCRLKAYKDAVGVWTIGYGHTNGVTEGMEITQEEADIMLKADIVVYESQVNCMVTRKLTPYQMDALTSFCYNVGRRNLGNSTLLKRINAGASELEIRKAWMRWVYAGGKVLPGLVKRRERELEHYFTQYITKGDGHSVPAKSIKSILAVAIILLAFASCKTADPVTKVEYIHDTTYIVDHRVDSVDRWHTHYEVIKGDTKFVYDTFYRDRWRTKIDTMYRDRVQYQDREVTKVEYKTPFYVYPIAAVGLIVTIIGIFYLVRYFLKRKI